MSLILKEHCIHYSSNLPVPSSEQESNNVLSGLKDVLYTGPVCPNNVLVVSADRSSMILCSTSSATKFVVCLKKAVRT